LFIKNIQCFIGEDTALFKVKFNNVSFLLVNFIYICYLKSDSYLCLKPTKTPKSLWSKDLLIYLKVVNNLTPNIFKHRVYLYLVTQHSYLGYGWL
jgi:hypothetical protein